MIHIQIWVNFTRFVATIHLKLKKAQAEHVIAIITQTPIRTKKIKETESLSSMQLGVTFSVKFTIPVVVSITRPLD